MIPIQAKLGAALIYTGLVFWVGWEWRDRSADVSSARADVKVESVRADRAEEARAKDHDSSVAAADVQVDRAERHDASESEFKIIERRVIEYVQANPDRADCRLDGDGLRAWNEANSGTAFRDPQPVDTGGPADTGPAAPSAGARR